MNARQSRRGNLPREALLFGLGMLCLASAARAAETFDGALEASRKSGMPILAVAGAKT